jgi:hypothetical protein
VGRSRHGLITLVKISPWITYRYTLLAPSLRVSSSSSPSATMRRFLLDSGNGQPTIFLTIVRHRDHCQQPFFHQQILVTVVISALQVTAVLLLAFWNVVAAQALECFVIPIRMCVFKGQQTVTLCNSNLTV